MMRIAYRRRIVWLALVTLVLQVLLMSAHHIADGALAPPAAAPQAGHESHHHSQDSTAGETTSVPCSFWLALNTGAHYTPPITAALSVVPSSSVVVAHVDTPFVPPQYLLTDLSSRGPPLPRA
jgi:hypothetical protein